MSRIFTKLSLRLQKLLFKFTLFFSLLFFNLRLIKYNNIWIIGNYEIAGILYGINLALPNSISINFANNKNYVYKYDIELPKFKNKFINEVLVNFFSPIIFGWYLPFIEGFIYLGNSSFLIMNLDQRNYEFSQIKKMNKKIVVYLTGSDIRSYYKMQELSLKQGEPNLGTIQGDLDPNFKSEKREKILIERCRVIEKYSDLTFNASADQASYFYSKTEPFLYFCPDELFLNNYQKDLSLIKICHITNSLDTKGTNLIRLEIQKLKLEGLHFLYTEIIDGTHEIVIQELESSHICINEMYSYMPGVLSVEAMAKMCVVITRANNFLEPDLGQTSEGAWVSAGPSTLRDELRYLILNTDLIRTQAIRGNEWARNFASVSASSSVINRKLHSI